MIDTSEYEGLARETGAFKDIELEILAETIAAWKERPGDPYTLLELRDGKVLAGFAVMSREAGTEYTFDIRSLCVEPSYIGKGVATSLIELLENEILKAAASAILRFETSKRKEAAIGEGVLSGKGYALIGHIPDFYAAGDDYFMFAKHLHHDPTEKAEAPKETK